jgi:hypothetical protein
MYNFILSRDRMEKSSPVVRAGLCPLYKLTPDPHNVCQLTMLLWL